METLRAGGRGGGREGKKLCALGRAEFCRIRAGQKCCVSMGPVFSALLPRPSALCLQVTTVAAGASNRPGSHVDGALL